MVVYGVVTSLTESVIEFFASREEAAPSSYGWSRVEFEQVLN
jgi:hypothetical protein